MESNHECDTKTKFGDGFESDSEEFGANQMLGCFAVARWKATSGDPRRITFPKL